MIKKKKYLSFLVLFAFMFGLVPILPAVGAEITQLVIEIDKTTIEENERISAEAFLIYADGSRKRVTSVVGGHPISWQSQDSTIAEVDKSGHITGKSAGTTYIDAIYTTPDMSVYSDQIQITVTAINYIPYSVIYSPTDGQLDPYEPIVMQFPVDVETTSDYYDLSGKNCGYKLYQDEDKTKVYIKLVLHPDYQPLFPDIAQLPWSTINSRINYITDDFKDYIKPVGGKWEYPAGNLPGYNFKSKIEQSLTLLGTYPQNNSTLYNKNLMGNTGRALNSILAPDEGANIPLVFLFNKPLKAGDISKFRIASTSPIGGITGHWSSFDTYFDDFSSYIVMPMPVYNYAVYGYNLTDVTATMTLEPGAFEVIETGALNTESYSTTYRINPSVAETSEDSQYIQGEVKTNQPLTSPKSLKKGNYQEIWAVDNVSRVIGAGISSQDHIVYGGENCIYAISKADGNIAWIYSSQTNDKTFYMKPLLGKDNIIYAIDYDYIGSLFAYQPSLIALNTDGSIRFKHRLPTTDSRVSGTNTICVTSEGDIVMIVSGTTAGGLGTRNFFIFRYNSEGVLKSSGLLEQGSLGAYGTQAPQIIWANESHAIYRDGNSNANLISLLQTGTFSSFTPIWSSQLPFGTLLGRYSVGNVIEDGDKIYLTEGHPLSLDTYFSSHGHNKFIELNRNTGEARAHTPSFVLDGGYTPSNFGYQRSSDYYILDYQDGVFYYNNGFKYNANTKETIPIFEFMKNDDSDYTTPRKTFTLGLDGNGQEIFIYRQRVKTEYSYQTKYFLGGDNWYDSNYSWDSYPQIDQVMWGSLILDNYSKLRKLDLATETQPIIPPVTPEPPKEEPKENPKDPPSGGGGGTTPEPPKEEPKENPKDPPGGGGGTTPEPPVEPEPEPEVIEPEPEVVEPTPEPEEPKPEPEPKPVVEPVITETPAKAPAPPRVIEYKEPEPVIKGVVRGTVMLSNGQPLANTRLELHSKPLSTITNAKGEYIFMDVPLGNHKLYIADIRVSDEKILLQNLTIDNEGKVHSIPISQVNSNKLAQAADIELSAEKPEQIVNMVVDYTLLQEPSKTKWPWLLLLLLLPILIRRRRRKQPNN